MSKRRKITSNLENETTRQEEIINQLADKNKKEENGTVRITIDIPKPQHRKIKEYTKQRGLTIKGYLLFLADQDMKDNS